MDFVDNPVEMLALASSIMLLLLCSNRTLEVASSVETEEDDNDEVELPPAWQNTASSSMGLDAMTQASLHAFQLVNTVRILEDDLGYWVKPRSTTWFSRFLLEQYDEPRWLKMFRFSKPSMFSLVEILKPIIEKKDTKYRLAIPVIVRVACTLFKLTHGASLLICSEMFAVGRSSVSILLRDVVHGINTVFRLEMSWPRGDKLLEIEQEFRQLCGLPGVVGAIDATHIGISKPAFCPADYYYFKSGAYSLNCQAVVDSKKRFLNIFVGMPGSTNDSRVLRRSALYDKALNSNLWERDVVFEGYSPYLLGDSGYPIMPWLMVPHREHGQLPLANSLFNRKLRRGRGVVENAFALLKQSFWELLLKTDLDVTFVPDMVLCCALLHNLLQKQSTLDVEMLLNVLREEGYTGDVGRPVPTATIGVAPVVEEFPQQGGLEKRLQLGLHLAQQRNLPF